MIAMRALPFALAVVALYGCPATVDVLESRTTGPAVGLESTNATQHFRVTVDTPGDAFPGEFGYQERLRIVADLATVVERSGEPTVALLGANLDDNTGESSHGRLQRATMYASRTEMVLEFELYDCGEDRCSRTFDVDFIKSGEGAISGTWRVEHTMDWTADEHGDPPADAESILTIIAR